jgi:hypothetical protein
MKQSGARVFKVSCWADCHAPTEHRRRPVLRRACNLPAGCLGEDSEGGARRAGSGMRQHPPRREEPLPMEREGRGRRGVSAPLQDEGGAARRTRARRHGGAPVRGARDCRTPRDEGEPALPGLDCRVHPSYEERSLDASRSKTSRSTSLKSTKVTAGGHPSLSVKSLTVVSATASASSIGYP